MPRRKAAPKTNSFLPLFSRNHSYIPPAWQSWRGGRIFAPTRVRRFGDRDRCRVGHVFASDCQRRRRWRLYRPAGQTAERTGSDWVNCGDGFLCATAQVPLDYNRPRDEQIGPAVIKLSA